jgi:hypothetical protein
MLDTVRVLRGPFKQNDSLKEQLTQSNEVCPLLVCLHGSSSSSSAAAAAAAAAAHMLLTYRIASNDHRN